MKFTVVWDDPSLAGLAARRIDRALSSDPLGHGWPISEELYGLDAPPLRVTFEVGAAARLVTVVGLSWSP